MPGSSAFLRQQYAQRPQPQNAHEPLLEKREALRKLKYWIISIFGWLQTESVDLELSPTLKIRSSVATAMGHPPSFCIYRVY